VYTYIHTTCEHKKINARRGRHETRTERTMLVSCPQLHTAISEKINRHYKETEQKTILEAGDALLLLAWYCIAFLFVSSSRNPLALRRAWVHLLRLLLLVLDE